MSARVVLFTCFFISKFILIFGDPIPALNINLRKPWVEERERYVRYYLLGAKGSLAVQTLENSSDSLLTVEISQSEADGKRLTANQIDDLGRFAKISTKDSPPTVSLVFTASNVARMKDDKICYIFEYFDSNYDLDIAFSAVNNHNDLKERLILNFSFSLDKLKEIKQIYDRLALACNRESKKFTREYQSRGEKEEAI